MPIDPICGMNVDKSTNLKLTVGNETYYFCGKHCLEKFAAIKGVNNKEAATCSSCCNPPSANAKWYKNKFIVTASILLILAGLSYFIPFLEPFRTHLWMYFKAIWLAVVIGIILGGVIDRFVPRQYVSKILAGSSKKTIFYSVMLGFLTSACSHGILACQ